MRQLRRCLFASFLLWLAPVLICAQSITANFTATPSAACALPTGCTSFTTNISGAVFVFTLTSTDAGGSMQWLPAGGGVGGSASMDVLSGTLPVEATTEKVVIERQDGGDFNFASIYIQNTGGKLVTVQGYNNGSPVGAAQTVANGISSTLNFSAITVDKVELSSVDFFETSFDNFSACITPVPSFTVNSICPETATSFTDASTSIATEATYAWDFNNDGITDNTTKGNVTYTYPAPGVYTANLTITQGGCSNSDSKQVTFLEVSAAPAINPLVCAGSSVSGTSSEGDGTIINVYKNGDYSIVIGTATISGGTWTATVSPALVADNSVTAKATANNKCISLASSPAVQVVASEPTTTTLISSLNPSFTTTPNNNVTLTATVTSGGNPVTTGTVTFKDGPTTIASGVTLNGSGQASTSASFATEGSHVITATYNGICPYSTSNGAITQQVNNRTTVTGNVFCNDISAITVGDNTTASPYPSRIFVSGLGTSITKLKVRINGFTHGLTSDVDVMLVGPGGQKLVLFSDAGNTGASGINLVFDDAAVGLLPTGALSSGTFRPTDPSTGDAFPAPAPASPNYPAPAGVSTLESVFNTIDPNGTWSLYIVDDNANNAGSISSWCLEITTCLITCPSVAPVSNTAGQCGANVTYSPASTTGNCGALTYSHPSGSFFPVGTTMVTVSSASTGQSCEFAVTVNDTEFPQITTCPGNQTVNTAPNQCQSAPVSFAAVATDNCPAAPTVKYYIGATEIFTGHNFPKGPNTLIVKAKDAAGNETTCSFMVTVNDAQNPTVTAPGDVTFNTGVGATTCNKLVTPAEFGVASHSDNCPGQTVEITGVPAGSIFPVGTTVLTYTVTDASGLKSTDQQNIIVVDNTVPVLTCPGNITVNTGSGTTTCNQTASWTVPTPTDNCAIQSLTSNYNPGATFPVGQTTVTYTAVDVTGNQKQCSFTVTVVDNTAPAISGCPSNITVQTGAGNTTCTQTATWTEPTSTDNCDGSTAWYYRSHTPGATFNLGPTTVTYKFKDGAGVESVCSFTVTVVDKTLPVINGCPTSQTVTVGQSGCSQTATWTQPTATDNCTTPLTYFRSHAPGSSFTQGTTAVTYKFKDAAGNESICTFNITVNGTLAATIPNASAYTTGVSANTIYRGWTPASKITYTASVSGGQPAYSYKWTTTNGLSIQGSSTQQSVQVTSATPGSYTLTLKVTDAFGCQSTATKTVTVVDVRCGNKMDKVMVCKIQPAGNICVNASDVANQLANGNATLGACPVNAAMTRSNRQMAEELVIQALSLKALPNPSTYHFNLMISGSSRNGKVTLRVTNILGQVVEVRNNVPLDQVIRIGEAFRSGTYLVEALQGNIRQQIKLIKL